MLGRRSAFALAAGLTLLSIWSAGSAWFILERDDIALRVFAGDAEATYAYEDRIKRLQDDLQREVTRNLVEHDGVKGRIDQVAARQAEIEAHQAWLGRIAERDGVASTVSVGLAPRPTTRPAAASSPQAGAALGLRLGRDADPVAPPPTGEAPRDRLSFIGRSLERVSQAQVSLVAQLSQGLEQRSSGLRRAVMATGLDVDRLGRSAVGGPLVPLPPGTIGGGAFGPLAAALESERAEYDRLLGVVRRLPIGRPLVGELEQTSPFGYRFDPFTRAPALHTGADFRAEWGSPVHATAAGRVSVAEVTGGYGNMVEIDHGGGLVTRYGHLSGYLVSVGDRVEAGQPIARAGSTGRSTGSHLHYETRIGGEPVDPTRFLSAGRLLAQTEAASTP